MCGIATTEADCEEENELRLSLSLCSHVNWFMIWSKSCKSLDKLASWAAATLAAITPGKEEGTGPRLTGVVEEAGAEDSWLLATCPVLTEGVDEEE